ncbi:MAG: hypothetical protein JKX84_01590, partial [Flavobacteriales bacterium]|nr:hypothetical protein [Flavobacteriales bacterium]
MRAFKLRFLLVTLLFGGALHSSAQQDCFNAINVCSNSYDQSNSFSGSGDVFELQPGATCLGNGEVNSVWYTFTASTSGNMWFQLNPLNPNDDYDFALFNMTNDSCSGIAQGLTQPISCNYSADPGPTGLSAGASGNSNGSSDPNQNPPITLQEGETYLLLISNFTASQNGYQLNFMGNGSIVDDQNPEPDSVSLLGVCNPRRLTLFFTEEIDCSSINGNGAEITV